ncbi:heme lyase CcmF/NrfE family subunit [Candidatus Nitrotoga fabula]|uniref:Holocytochrome c synthetase membrane subunit CcmF n=1 Tax=Candidatus Nitrotoga fabula TaxID=2182327 RepID=A0A916FB73_9PROT|nr:heme lyase CcmF/NrfE family subunit [Candidatus Nitrotoga fabula]CAE6694518.1 holocytochrome c synthetase membrane subunit CcmF [Candidatus Nitrotoga fabula]
MIPEIGNFSLMLALAVALLLGILPIAGSMRGNQQLMAFARPAARTQLAFIAIAFGCLVYSFVNNDFSVKYVALHSNSLLPVQYRIAAVWGGHEGSLLLWMLMLGGWMLAVTLFSKRLPQEMLARVLGVMGLISVGFLSFTLFTSNPFERLLPAAMDGRDLNPLLQDPGMIFHPPLLYMGYVGFSVAFSFAIAALIGGKLDATWARWSRPWTTVAWMFLTLGIMLGSWWAYYELGWGGWWFWDPVENASFMPWLVGTALIHSLAVTEKRGAFKNWTVLLAIMAFSLSLLGTFLVRSGVLTSVHSFAADPSRGLFILAFLSLVVGCSLVLFAWRAPKVGLGSGFGLVSRESILLLNNVLLVAAAGSVFLGTLYPLFLDALNLGKISVGPPYFEAVFTPIMAITVFLMGVGPRASWKQASLTSVIKHLAPWFIVSIALGLLVPSWFGRWTAPVVAGTSLGMWALLTSAAYLATRIRQSAGTSAWATLRSTSRSTYGMLLAHAGIGIFILGVTLVKGYETSSEMRLRVGDATMLDDYSFHFLALENVKGPNYSGIRATLEVTLNGTKIDTLYPEKRIYTRQDSAMTEGAIYSSPFRHLYAALGEQVSQDEWIVRVQHKPMVNWIWGGCIIMALGGLLAVSDRRYRLPLTQR